MSKVPPPPTPAPLDLGERIEKLHEEIEAFIQVKVEEARKDAGGFVPAVRIYHDMQTKAGWCQCVAYRQNAK
jgi:hypothetical protein